MTADPDAPVPYWPVLYTPGAPQAMYDVMPISRTLTPAGEAALDDAAGAEPEAG